MWSTGRAATPHSRLAHEDPPQPRLEAFHIAEVRQLAPGRDDRLLDGVLGAVEVAQDALGHRKQPVRIRARQHSEGLAVSVPVPTRPALDPRRASPLRDPVQVAPVYMRAGTYVAFNILRGRGWACQVPSEMEAYTLASTCPKT